MTVENSTAPRHGSEEWCRILDVNVMDPDGWNRGDLTESWNELIDEQEFWRRYSNSTILGGGYMPTRFAESLNPEAGEEMHEVTEQPLPLFERMKRQVAEDIIQKMLLAVPPTPGNIAHVKQVAQEYGVEIHFDH